VVTGKNSTKEKQFILVLRTLGDKACISGDLLFHSVTQKLNVLLFSYVYHHKVLK